MSTPDPSSAPTSQPPEWYCHACSRTTRTPLRRPDLQCPYCNSDFLEELSSADDPRRISDFPQDLPFPGAGAATANPFHSLLANLLGAASARPDDHDQDQEDESNDDPARDQGEEHTHEPRFHFTFMTSGVDAQGRRFTTTHGNPFDQTHSNEPQDPSQAPQEPQPQPQNLTQFLNQAFSSNPNPPTTHDPSSLPDGANDRPDENSNHQNPQHPRVVPMSMAGLLGSMLGAAGPASDGPTIIQANTNGGGGLQFIFNSTFGPMQGPDGTPVMQWGDALNDRGFDNFITALMNQAASNAEGPRRAPDEVINQLPRKLLKQEDLDSFRSGECAICKEDFVVEEDVITLPCTHVFHADCIVPWLERSGTCAVCRYELVPQPHPHSPGNQQRPPQPAPQQTEEGQAQQQEQTQQQQDQQTNAPPPAEGRPHTFYAPPGQTISDILSRMFGVVPQRAPRQEQEARTHEPSAPDSAEPTVASGVFSGEIQAEQASGDSQQQEQQDSQEQHGMPEQEPLD